MTLTVPSLSKRQLKLQAACPFRFMCKHIVDNTLHTTFLDIWELGKFQKISRSKNDFQGHSRSLVMMPFDRPHTISY